MVQTTRKALLLALMSVLAAGWVQGQTESAFDLVITNGHIIDGTGSPWYSGDVGIRGGKIAAIGNLSSCHAPLQAGDWPLRHAGVHRHARPVRDDDPCGPAASV